MSKQATAVLETSIIAPKVKVISFDIWRTLLRGNREFTWPRLELVCAHLGISGFDREELFEAYFAAERWANDMSVAEGLDYGQLQRLQRFCLNLGASWRLASSTLDALRADLMSLRLQPRFLPELIEPDVRDTLQALRNDGYRLALLSNTGMSDGRTMRQVLDQLQLTNLIDHMELSDESGLAKPHPKIFVRLAEWTGVRPWQVLHIGDNVRADYYGARNAGLYALHYAPEGSGEEHITALRELIRQ